MLNRIKYITNTLLLLALLLASCAKIPDQSLLVLNGEFNKEGISKLRSTQDVLPSILKRYNMTEDRFISLITSYATEADVDTILKVGFGLRDSLFTVKKKVELYERLLLQSLPLYQKVIPLSEVENYLSNRYRDVRGIVHYGADMKILGNTTSQVDMSWLGLYYQDSPYYDAQFSGYAVIRFLSAFDPMPAFSNYFWEMVDQRIKDTVNRYTDAKFFNYPMPFTGSGFVQGGFAQEFFCCEDPVPLHAELYEVTPQGREILRGQTGPFGWVPAEGEYVAKTKSETNFPISNKIKNGLCAKLGADYYHAFLKDNTSLRLVSNIESEGFKADISGYYYCDLPIMGSDYAFLYTHTVYKGDTLQVRTLDFSNFYHLTTSDPEVAKRLRMKNVDYGTYRLFLHSEELNEADFFDVEE